MNKKKADSKEHKMDELMHGFRESGNLQYENFDDALDLLLSKIPAVQVSPEFQERALEAIAQSESERERRNPSVKLGVSLARARERIGLDLSQLADRVRISVQLINSLELGELSIRQIIHNFPPVNVRLLLTDIKLDLTDFGASLMELVSFEVRSPERTVVLGTSRIPQRDSSELLDVVSEYLAAIEEADSFKED